MTYLNDEAYKEICLDLREGRLSAPEFRWLAIKLKVSDKTIEEDLVVFKWRKT